MRDLCELETFVILRKLLKLLLGELGLKFFHTDCQDVRNFFQLGEDLFGYYLEHALNEADKLTRVEVGYRAKIIRVGLYNSHQRLVHY